MTEDPDIGGAGVVTSYRLGVAHLVRLSGSLILGLGIVWLAATLLGVGGPGRVILAVLTVACLLLLIVVFARPPRVLRLDDVGYQVHWVRGAGRTGAPWRQVDKVTSTGTGGSAAMVFELKDGATTVLPLTLLGTNQLNAQRAVHDRLNTAYGYRRLDQP